MSISILFLLSLSPLQNDHLNHAMATNKPTVLVHKVSNSEGKMRREFVIMRASAGP